MITVGIDEVGRGCWAGPLVAGAVILRRPIDGLKDSKLLSKARREKLAEIIKREALAVGLGWVEPSKIDNLGMTEAVRLAMTLALAEIKLNYDEVIIDGNYNYLVAEPKARFLIKADSLVPAVSAASIVAKVARDNFMTELDDKYQAYGFDKHVGYGTKAHVEALAKLGVSDLHRRSFKPIRELLA